MDKFRKLLLNTSNSEETFADLFAFMEENKAQMPKAATHLQAILENIFSIDEEAAPARQQRAERHEVPGRREVGTYFVAEVEEEKSIASEPVKEPSEESYCEEPLHIKPRKPLNPRKVSRSRNTVRPTFGNEAESRKESNRSMWNTAKSINYTNDDGDVLYVCVACKKEFKSGVALGGHWSRAHPGQSETYKHKMTVRKQNETEREKRKTKKTKQTKSCSKRRDPAIDDDNESDF